MKVKCIDVKKPNKDSNFRGLTVGKEYIVLAVEFYNNTSIFSNSVGDFAIFRLEDDNGTVIPYPAKLFEITSGRMPKFWVCYTNDGISYELLPSRWARRNFWDDFYNDEPNTIKDFADAKQDIYSFETDTENP